jgi:hypothetical protein
LNLCISCNKFDHVLPLFGILVIVEMDQIVDFSIEEEALNPSLGFALCL